MRYPNSNGNGFYSLVTVEDFEFSNPILKMKENIIAASLNLDKSYLDLIKEEIDIAAKEIPTAAAIIERVLHINAIKGWDQMYKEIMSSTLPDKLFDLLECNSKKEQWKILHGLSLSTDSLYKFIFQSYKNYGFTNSSYTIVHNHTGFNSTNMPSFAYKEKDNSITKIGSTTLTDGEIKMSIEQRKVVIAKFLEKDDIWHCFFYTYNSMLGKETGNKPHMHYVSSAWNFTREEALLKLRDKHYSFSSVPHIDFINHRQSKNQSHV